MILQALTPQTTIHSGCKINLYLEILGRLENGYHSLKTYMLPLQNPHDTLIIDVLDTRGSIQIDCAHSYIDSQNNTLTKAYAGFLEYENNLPALHIKLIKNIPIGAGLGGGSANAAKLLLFLNELCQKQALKSLSPTELLSLAAKIGADVSFFINNTPAWALGFGEKLIPCSHIFDKKYLLILCPKINISTTWAYNEWDKLNKNLLNCLTLNEHQDSKTFATIPLFNSFEAVVFKTYPLLKELKEELYQFGAIEALLSGSGSSIFGIFDSKQTLITAQSSFEKMALRNYTQSIHAGASPSW